MTFREQKPASRVFLRTLYGLAALAVAVLLLAVFGTDYSRRAASDYAAVLQKKS